MEDFYKDLEERFLKKTKKLGNIHGCVAWDGYVDKLGYGVMNVNWPREGAKKERAHRLAYMIKERISHNDMPRLDENNNRIECSHLCHKTCVNSEHILNFSPMLQTRNLFIVKCKIYVQNIMNHTVQG